MPRKNTPLDGTEDDDLEASQPRPTANNLKGHKASDLSQFPNMIEPIIKTADREFETDFEKGIDELNMKNKTNKWVYTHDKIFPGDYTRGDIIKTVSETATKLFNDEYSPAVPLRS